MKTTIFILALGATMMMSSCATIVTGTNPEVMVEGNIPEPVTIETSYGVYTDVQLPYMVKLKGKHLNGQRIQVNSENYEFKDVLIRKSVNSWAFGNILIGGLIGWGIDLLTNRVANPSEDTYYLQYRKKKNEKPQTEQTE